jgi:hypothetical protein
MAHLLPSLLRSRKVDLSRLVEDDPVLPQGAPRAD